MLDKFSKLEKVSEINKNFIDVDSVEQQLKSMKLGYIQLAFVLRGMEKDYQEFHDKNFKKFSEETIDIAEKHALKQIDDPDYYKSEAMKGQTEEIKKCVQSLMMIWQKKDEVKIKKSELEVVERNIDWLKEVHGQMIDKKVNGIVEVKN